MFSSFKNNSKTTTEKVILFCTMLVIATVSELQSQVGFSFSSINSPVFLFSLYKGSTIAVSLAVAYQLFPLDFELSRTEIYKQIFLNLVTTFICITFFVITIDPLVPRS